MLTQLSIQNYALIKELQVNFDNGFSIITGETGAGKSILLGALGLVLGKRADLSYLKDTTQKCIVEAEFDISNYKLEKLFDTIDLDYEPQTIIRREILPNGKSRAFVNDTPTTLNVLSSLSEQLIDVHSQHQTLSLSETAFQFNIVDTLAKNETKIASYKKGLKIYNSLQKELDALVVSSKASKQQHDYNLHLFNELQEAQLVEGEQEKIEAALEALNNIETIKSNLSEAYIIANDDELGLLNFSNHLKSKFEQISSFSESYLSLYNRTESLVIELKDIIRELELANESIDYNPTEIEKLNDKLQLIYTLQKKHNVSTIKELLEIQEELSEKVDLVENSSAIIDAKKVAIEKVEADLDKVASMIYEQRVKAIPKLQSDLEVILSELGMTNSRFKFELTLSSNYYANGKDDLKLLFSSNRGDNYGELKKIASGGELSRIMLSVKLILSKYISLPTIIFDEIDTGVSGEVSDKMGDIMKVMSENMQVISITHLPQIASKGKQHFKVFKEDKENNVSTQLKVLSQEERVQEIAMMLSGKNISESALAHAKELLN